MAGIIAQLSHLVLIARYEVVTTEQYMGESKEWLTACDWKKASCKLRHMIRTLLDLRYRLKPTYP